ncbi:hypothetical protein KJ636_01990 [Patescibacteria group bacterium]|nr:hypothetical protein [Patescibacteria group bacterium]
MTKKGFFNLISKAKKAQSHLAFSSFSQRNEVLRLIGENLEENLQKIIRENQKDLKKMDTADPRHDRLLLNEKRILSVVD